MPTLTRKDYSLGWIPSDDPRNGRKNGLVRMDNLQLDDQGIVSLTRAFKKVSSQFSGVIRAVYSKTIGATKHRYVGDGTSVKKAAGGTSFGTTVLSGGDIRHAFGSGLGEVIICSGTQKKKDNGTSIRDLEVPKPSTTPNLITGTKLVNNTHGTFTNYTLLEGTDLIKTVNHVGFTTTAESFRGKVQLLQNIDGTAFGSTGRESEEDSFVFEVRVGDSARLVSIRVEFILSTIPADPAEAITDYYFLEIPNATPSQYNIGKDTWSTVIFKRKDFIRAGNNANLNWANIKAVRFSVQATAAIPIIVSSARFEGGVDSLDGRYSWYQVNVLNTGRYIGFSSAGPVTDIRRLNNQRMLITPNVVGGFGSTYNEMWFYRKKEDVFDTYYRVAVRTNTLAFIDTTTDEEALRENKRIELFLDSVPDNVIGIEGIYFDRMIYMTLDKIFFSRRFDIGIIDTRYTLDVSGDTSEINLWIKKVSPSSLLIGTSRDIYELSGTGRSLPDGTLDFLLRPYGISNPPISRAVTVHDGNVIYMSRDGWRVVSGSRYDSLIGETRLLYQKEERSGIRPVLISGKDQVIYDCAVANNKLFTVVTLDDSSRRVFVYDLIKAYWYPYFTDPTAFFTEEDGTLLAGYGSPGDRFLREMDTGVLIDNLQKQSFHFRTVFDDLDQVNRRKDLYTLKLFLDTGGDQVTVKVAKNGESSFTTLGTTFSANGPTLLFIPVFETNVNLLKSLQLDITNTGTGVNEFKLFHWSLDFDSRPEQVNHLRIPPYNFGVAGRKRFYEIPISLDTLGDNVNITPIIDGNLQASLTIPGSALGKLYFNYLFPAETLGRELGWDLQASSDNVFEFYEIINPEKLEVLPDPVKFYRIPFDNLGVPSRKRFIIFAFVIDTRGSNVTFIPIVDGTSFPSAIVNTNRKQTYLYYFETDATGTDIGGTLTGSSEFEFYGVLREDTVFEKLPPPTEFVNLSCTNFGVAAKKRIRTIPFVIDTKGGNVTYTPVVDGVARTPTVFNTNEKGTVFHYFTDDVFGVDYCGTLKGDSPFEFYEQLAPYGVEILPIARKFDQVGPITIPRLAKLREIFIRILTPDNSLVIRLLAEGTEILLRTLVTTPNVDELYRIDVPKTVKGTTFRLEISGTNPFHRFYVEFKYTQGGNETSLKRVKIEDTSVNS